MPALRQHVRAAAEPKLETIGRSDLIGRGSAADEAIIYQAENDGGYPAKEETEKNAIDPNSR